MAGRPSPDAQAARRHVAAAARSDPQGDGDRYQTAAQATDGQKDRYQNRSSCLKLLAQSLDVPAAAIAALNSLTAAPGPCGWSQTAAMTARKSAPASTSTRQFCGVIPPMAQQGTVMVSLHQRKISGSFPAMRRVSLVVERKNPPKAT